MLQYVEAVFALSGATTASKSAPTGIFTETITVGHQGKAASVLESVVFVASDGSSATTTQRFTITDKSTTGRPDYVVYVPSANFVLELNLTHPYINDRH